MKTVIAVLLLLSHVALAQSRPKPSLNCPAGAACITFNQMKAGHDEDIRDADWACFYTEASTTRPKESYNFAGANPASITYVHPIVPSSSDNPPTTDEFFLLMDGSKAEIKHGLHPGIFEKSVTRGLPEEWSGFGPKHGGVAEAFNPDWAGEHTIIRTFDDLGSEFRFATFKYTTPKAECDNKVIMEGKSSTQASPRCTGNSCEKFSQLIYYDLVTIQKSTGQFVRTQRDLNHQIGFVDAFSGQCSRLNQPMPPLVRPRQTLTLNRKGSCVHVFENNEGAAVYLNLLGFAALVEEKP